MGFDIDPASASDVPVDVGVMVTPMVQLAPAANDPGLAQVVVSVGASAYSPPDTASELIVRATAWVFLRVTVFAALAVLITTFR